MMMGVKKINRTRMRRFSELHVRMQRGIEKSFIPQVDAAIKKQITVFLKGIDDFGLEYMQRNVIIKIPFREIQSVIKRIYYKTAFIESNYVLNYLRERRKGITGLCNRFGFEYKRGGSLGVGFGELATIIDQYFQVYLLNNSALPITATTRRIVIDHLIAEVEKGVPLAQALAEFKDLALTGGSVFSLPRAIRIAKTESTRGLSFGGMIGAYMTGVDVDKVWVTSNDERVRGLPNYPAEFSHVLLDLQGVPMLGNFYNGEMIRFPGDPEASISNTVNCRCAMFFKEKQNPAPQVIRSLNNFLGSMFPGFIIGAAGELIESREDQKR
jgi:hypothetical protein